MYIKILLIRFNALQAAFPQFHTNTDQRAEAVKKIFIETHTELKNEIPKLNFSQKVFLTKSYFKKIIFYVGSFKSNQCTLSRSII